MHTAVHARGVVDHDTAHHGRADAGGVRREHTAVGLQDLVHTGPHDARLELDCLLILAYLILFPMLACYDEHAVGTTLS